MSPKSQKLYWASQSAVSASLPATYHSQRRGGSITLGDAPLASDPPGTMAFDFCISRSANRRCTGISQLWSPSGATACGRQSTAIFDEPGNLCGQRQLGSARKANRTARAGTRSASEIYTAPLVFTD